MPYSLPFVMRGDNHVGDVTVIVRVPCGLRDHRGGP